MNSDIKIEYKHYTLPYKIIIDGVNYPNTQHNWDIIAEYNKTSDEKVLDRLSSAVIEF